ncbi:hypothetical protein [Thermochromatium tepidum]|uniref:Uncharacterized protein n=1 Tax=Thermochromatium tepidum ATCC 43061 TaxID=316276 RepID=A0A6I6EE42_THETI|nr:hypothetical protein [Thermochromatium tepidum]QGU33249.1 hypothetical protein E6P07_09820 [Thermochromatium tepidum ATCC 43061]
MSGNLDSQGQHARLHTGRLILTPADPHRVPDINLLIEGLCGFGLLGEPLSARETAIEPGERAFAVGPGFLSLLTFAGCAVQIRDHRNPGRFSYIRVPQVSLYPRLMLGRNTRSPRCVGCRAPLSDWRERVEHWAKHPHSGVRCPACGETRPPWLWDWKQQGGFGRVFLCIEEVFPGEAVPTPAFLEQLMRVSGISWRHFYIQD